MVHQICYACRKLCVPWSNLLAMALSRDHFEEKGVISMYNLARLSNESEISK
jgi:hypothetical protein